MNINFPSLPRKSEKARCGRWTTWHRHRRLPPSDSMMFNIKLKKRVSHPLFCGKVCVLCQSESVVKKRGRLRNSWTLKHSKSENIWTELFAVEYRHVQVMLPSSLNQNSPWISPFSQSGAFFLFQLLFSFWYSSEKVSLLQRHQQHDPNSRLRYFRMSGTLVSDSIRFYRLLLQQSSWGWCFCRPLTSLDEMKHNNVTNFPPSFHLVFMTFLACSLSHPSAPARIEFRISLIWLLFRLRCTWTCCCRTCFSRWCRREERGEEIRAKVVPFKTLSLFFFGVKLLWHSLPK